jgi:hypothetical protein
MWGVWIKLFNFLTSNKKTTSKTFLVISSKNIRNIYEIMLKQYIETAA